MMHDTDPRRARPRARTERLVVEELDGEVLVYDKLTHEAHCLNGTAAFVWRLADGATPVSEMVSALPDAGLPAEESLVWMAIDRLQRANLLQQPTELPGARSAYTRKEVLRVLGAAAGMVLLLPAVDSVTAPLAAQAASCITKDQCENLDPRNCTGLPICGKRKKCCIRKREREDGKIKWECKSRNCR